MEILTNHTLHMSLVAWYMLQAHLVCRASDPILSMFASISENILCRFIANYKSPSRGSGSIESNCVSGPCLRSSLLYLDASVLDDGAVNITSRHAKEIVLGRNKACIPWEVVFLKYSSPLIETFS